MEISIIIPTKDREKIFNKTLEYALRAIQNLPAEIIVVNDSKTSIPTVPNNPKIKLINNPKQGVAAARNLGARNSTKELLLFVDNDILISKESLMHTIRLHEQYTNASFNVDWEYPPDLQQRLLTTSFGRFLKKFNMTSFKGWYNDGSWQDNTMFSSPALASFHLSILKKDFDRVGGYQEEFPFAGFEDYDFPVRLKQHQISLFIDSRILVFHNEADRLEMENWLMNWERRSSSRRAGIRLGYAELAIHYSAVKKLILKLGLFGFPLLSWVLQIWPNVPAFDKFFFKLVGFAQAIRIYKGYTEA